jgi:integrase/recombinase XerD
MTQTLLDCSGNRKYLVSSERIAFVAEALNAGGAIASFCLTLALTGARISEALALTVERVDANNGAIIFETLKRRKRSIFRANPVPEVFLDFLEKTHNLAATRANPAHRSERLWPWGRTVAWKRVKNIMKNAGIADTLAKPKALRHGFAVEAGQNGVHLNIVQRWLGHARIETTAIYASALGDEERALAERTWRNLERAFRR